MDAELLELQRQFESAQQAKSTIRLSDRNVVELIQKLQELQFLDYDLLHTISGKEYITPDQLRVEMETEIRKSGRVSLIDLSDVIGVDLFHVERQAQKIVADGSGLMMVNGEIITQGYWDSVAEEINEKLQECSQISLAEIAGQLQVGSEMVVSFLEPRLGTIVKGRLEGGQLYTPAYVSRISAMVRGAARGITVPTNLPTVWNLLQQVLQDMDGANGVSVEGSFFQSIFNGLLKEGDILGSLRAGVQWTPAVFAHAQRESVDSFFSQNSYISYEVLHKLLIPQPKQYLQSRYPEGIPLDVVFVHPSMVEMLDFAVGDAIDHGNWLDCTSVLPAYIGGSDASKILSLCPSLQSAIKCSTAVLLGDSCVFSNAFIKGIYDQLEKELDTFVHKNPSQQGPAPTMHPTNELKVGPSSTQHSETKELDDDAARSKSASEKGLRKKRGKVTGGSAKGGTAEKDSDNQEHIPNKGKKNQRKNKDASSLGTSDAKSSAKKDKVREDNLNIPSEEWVMQRILTLSPDLEELGGSEEDSHEFLRILCSHVRPMLVNSWAKRRNTLLSGNAERRKQLLDDLQKYLDEVVFDIQLYEKALDLFEDDPSTSAILHKHLLKTMATPIVDKLLFTLDMDNKLKNGIEDEDSQNQPVRLTPADRISLAKSFPASISVKTQALVEALEGKTYYFRFSLYTDMRQRVDTFMDALRVVAEESGLSLKKLDKKLERTMLHSFRKDLMSQVSSENDPVMLLPKVVALLHMQVHNKALQSPGRAISAVVARLKDKLPNSTYKVLMDYHSATVTLLALQAASTGDEEDCSADRILSKKEMLESLMPELKAAVLGPTNS